MPETNVEQLLEVIGIEVSKKRTMGEYPPGLEQELEAEFKDIMSMVHRGLAGRNERISELLEVANSEITGLTGNISTRSKIPFVGSVRKIMQLLTRHQIRGIANQVRDTQTSLLKIIELLGDEAQSREDADRRMVAHLSKHVLSRIAVVDHLSILVVELEAKIKQLETTK